MNFPNKLTISRIFLTFIFMFLLKVPGILAKVSALLVFIFACLSDLYDGRIARKRKEISDFGKLMDPIADKILIFGAFLIFVQMQLVPAWIVVVIIFRELLITGLRLFAFSKNYVLEATRAGKHKTASQMIAIFLILILLIIKESLQNFLIWEKNLEKFFYLGIYLLSLVVMLLTLISGISYLWQNRRMILKI